MWFGPFHRSCLSSVIASQLPYIYPVNGITVDGGWSKRSHKHSYNAKSGVAVVIGKATGKLLTLRS